MQFINQLFSNFNEKYLEEAKNSGINLGLQTVYTPINKIEAATGFRFVDYITAETRSVAVLFNTEFINYFLKVLPLDYIKNIKFTFFYDCKFDKKQVGDCIFFSKTKFNIEMISIENIDELDKIMAGKKFDIVFSNPPYNDGLDLKILTNIKESFKKAIIVHPAVWILSNKESGKFNNFKVKFANNIEKLIIFRGSDMFNVPFMSALDICVFNNEKTNSNIDVNDNVINCKYSVESYKDITHYGDMWFKVDIKGFINKCKTYTSILDVENRFPHFNFPEKVKYPINITEFRAGNPHFNDGYYDEKLGYYVLNKTNCFFTCIAKGDKEKYHYKFDNKHVVLSYTFNTEIERENFYNYCKSKVFRFILSYLKVNAHNNTGELCNTPWLDFTQEWNDAKLCKEFEISEELWNYIDNFIPDYYDDYESGFDRKKLKTIIKTHYGDLPNDEMMEFCGKEVIDYLLYSKSNSKNGVSTYKTFKKDCEKYHALKELRNNNKIAWRVLKY